MDKTSRGGTVTQLDWHSKDLKEERGIRAVDVVSRTSDVTFFIDKIWTLMTQRRDFAPSKSADMWLWIRVMLSRLQVLAAEGIGCNQCWTDLVNRWADVVGYNRDTERLEDGGEAMDAFTAKGRGWFRDWATSTLGLTEYDSYAEMVVDRKYTHFDKQPYNIYQYNENLAARLLDLGIDVYTEPDHSAIRGPRPGERPGDKGGVIYRRYVTLLPTECQSQFTYERLSMERMNRQSTLTDLWRIAQTSLALHGGRTQRRDGGRPSSHVNMIEYLGEQTRADDEVAEIHYTDRGRGEPLVPCRDCTDRNNGVKAMHSETRCLQVWGRGKALFMCKVGWSNMEVLRALCRMGLAAAEILFIREFNTKITLKPTGVNEEEVEGQADKSWRKLMAFARSEGVEVKACDNPACVFKAERQGGMEVKFGDLRNGPNRCNAYGAFNWLCQKAAGNTNIGRMPDAAGIVAALTMVERDLVAAEVGAIGMQASGQ